jgi:hypothetical protein
MKFYKLDEIATRSDDQVFKTSPIGKGIALFIFSALALGCLGLAIRGGIAHDRVHVPSVFLYCSAAFLGLFVWIAYAAFRASLRPSNWLLRCNSTGIIIKYRSYLNWHLPADDPQAVGFDYAEIAWVRSVKEKRLTPDMQHNNTTQIAFLTYLDFCLSTKTDLSALEAKLQAERSFSPEGFLISRDYPVGLSKDGMLELRWNGGISPSAKKAIDYLKQYVQVVAAESRTVDLVHRRNLPPEQERGKIIELLKSGDELGAVKLTREIYGYSLSEAHDFVEKLQEEGPEASGSQA